MVPPPTDVVTGVLEDYAQRGTFRGFSPGKVRNGRASYKMQWHRDRVFELIVDANKGWLRFPAVLPEVSREMFGEFREYIASRQSEELPEHRRIDKSKATIKAGRSEASGDASLTLNVVDGDWEYATRALISLVHEVYLGFLYDGRYYDYLIETFDLDPDHVS